MKILILSIIIGIILAGILGYVGGVPTLPFVVMLILGGIGGATISLMGL